MEMLAAISIVVVLHNIDQNWDTIATVVGLTIAGAVILGFALNPAKRDISATP